MEANKLTKQGKGGRERERRKNRMDRRV